MEVVFKIPNLPFESLEYDNQKYIMRKGPIMAEFYKFD